MPLEPASELILAHEAAIDQLRIVDAAEGELSEVPEYP